MTVIKSKASQHGERRPSDSAIVSSLYFSQATM